jgi:YNFM family putative membrane transporter
MRQIEASTAALQAVVFALVAATFTTIYITQPVLPVIQAEFGVSESVASLSVSAVILGIALANLPFGVVADRLPIRPIIFAGSAVVCTASLICAATRGIALLIAARFVQGLFIPAMTTCLVAYLARRLPAARLNVVMGSYVSATVAGGLGGRLLGGFIHPPLHWRYAFVSASLLLFLAAAAAVRWLPPDDRPDAGGDAAKVGFFALLKRPELLRIFCVAFCAFFVFSAMFNYMPFYLSRPPIRAPIRVITAMYLAYVVGIATGPIAGRLSNRLGVGRTLSLGAALLAAAIAATLKPWLPLIGVSLAGMCAGFFCMHAAAVGALNRRLEAGRGRANSLYVLFYYLGGGAGISATGVWYARWGWPGCVSLALAVLAIPLGIGIFEASIPAASAAPGVRAPRLSP